MRKYMLIVGAALAGILAFSLFGRNGLIHLYKADQERLQLEEKVADMERENERLRQEIQKLTNDPQYVEKVAREELGMVKPDELVFHLPDSAQP